ncbi:MAG: hypothetical protein R2691_00640 [Solirubrobacterales bacterium]
MTWIRRLALLPLLPISGRGQAAYEPILAEDGRGPWSPRSTVRPDRFGAFAGPERLTHKQQARLIAVTAGRQRPAIHIPLPFVRSALIWPRRIFGEVAFATWEEAGCLLEVPLMVMSAARQTSAAPGVEPARMAAVLAAT